MAKDELPPDARAQDHLEQVAKAGERAAALVRRLLVFSRKSDASNKPIEIVPVIVDTLQLLRASIPSSIELRQDIDPDCGYVQADPALIQQVTMNLCTNAYQAMQSSVGRLTVTLAPIVLDNSHATLPPGSYVKLTVTDTGPGIPPKEAGPGSGLGLTVVPGVVANCGGSVRFESTPGSGNRRSLSIYRRLPLFRMRRRKCSAYAGRQRAYPVRRR